MAKFQYRMQSILNIKLKMEEQAKMQFAQAQAKVNEEEAKHYTPLLNGTVRLLFVGVNFFANTHGIKWFIDNVLPNIH